MQRWVLERGGLVRGYMLVASEPTEAQKRALAFGTDAEGDLADAGTWRLVPESAGLVGDDWIFDGTTYARPVRA